MGGGANTSYFQDKGVYYLNYMLYYTARQARRTSKASHVLLDDTEWWAGGRRVSFLFGKLLLSVSGYTMVHNDKPKASK